MASVFVLMEAFNRKRLLHLDFFLVQQPLLLWQNMRKCEIIRRSNGLPVGALHLSQFIFQADI